MVEKSKVLIIRATGRLVYHLARFNIQYSHPTFLLIKCSSFSNPNKRHKIHTLSTTSPGRITLLKRSLKDEENLVAAVKQVDVVICAIPSKQVLDQKLLNRVIKNAICSIKLQPLYELFTPNACTTRPKTPPKGKVSIFKDGNIKGVFMKNIDVAAFTISALDDPCTLNKVLYLRPPKNVYFINELVETWDSKIGKRFEKIYVLEEDLLKKIEACCVAKTPYPDNMEMIFIYFVFVKGDHTYFDIEFFEGVDGTQLYPHLKYTTIKRF